MNTNRVPACPLLSLERTWTAYSARSLPYTKEHPVLITEAPVKATREKMVTTLFEVFEVPAVYIATPAVLSLLATGRRTGVVVDLGHSSTRVVPIYEGYAVSHAIRNLDIAGKSLTDNMARRLTETGELNRFSQANLRNIARGVKETLGYVASDFAVEMQAQKRVRYELPDGEGIVLGTDVFECPEMLFQPRQAGKVSGRLLTDGLPAVTVQSISECDVDIRMDLHQNVVLSGGTSLLWGLGGRMRKELDALGVAKRPVNITMPPQHGERHELSAWLGGAMLASLSSFEGMCFWKTEFDELGPKFVHQLCF